MSLLVKLFLFKIMTNILKPNFGSKSTKEVNVNPPSKEIQPTILFRSPNHIYFPGLNCYLLPNTPL